MTTVGERLARRAASGLRFLGAVLVCALVCVTALLGHAHAAAPKHTVLLLPIASEGLLASDREALVDRLAPAFDHPDIALIRGTSRSSQPDSCADEACLRELGRAREATHVVQVEVIADGRDYRAELRVVRVAETGPPNIVDAGCEICGLAEFHDRLAARAVVARDVILAVPRIGGLELVGGPARAMVRIDGRLRGHLPLSTELDAGQHELVVRASGHFPQVIPIETLAGVDRQLTIELEPKPAPAWRRRLGWSLLGTGVASLAVGTALIGVHGSPAALRCDTDEPGVIDADGDCRWDRRTLGIGVGSSLVGIAATSAGATLLVIDDNRRRAQVRARLSAQVGPRHVQFALEF